MMFRSEVQSQVAPDGTPCACHGASYPMGWHNKDGYLSRAIGKKQAPGRQDIQKEETAQSLQPLQTRPVMLHVALLEPEIPPNTGNIARLCAATGSVLHLIGRLGFRLDERSLRRAGLDYWPAVEIERHATLDDFEAKCCSRRIFCFSAHASMPYTRVAYQDGDCLLFGNESAGLPAGVLQRHAERSLCIPMPAGNVRSLNLATAVGIVLYEALRQINGW
jgi:tRNA (cytidine/uridine-2'-O-)-methyltransferase